MQFDQKATLFLLCLLMGGTLSAQRSEIGFGVGTLNYTGDLTRSYNFLNSKPAGTVFYRTNVSKFASIRAAITAGKIGASDRKRAVDAFAQQRNASFNVFLFEASAVVEYHFLNWRETKHFLRFSPYLFGGLGLF